MPYFVRFLGLFLLFQVVAFYWLAQAREIGTVAAVNPDVTGTTGETRLLGMGDGVVADERITASELGSGQILFLDQTTLTISPGAEIVLDSFVYDPDAGTGSMALTMTRGALRFIGGRITKGQEATIDTPTSTIGIRGGMGLIRVGADGATQVIHIAGEYTRVRSRNGSEVVLSRASAKAVVQPGGGASYAGLASTEEMTDAYTEMEGDGDGGLVQTGSEDGSFEAGGDSIEQENSGLPGASDREPVSTTGERSETSTVQLSQDIRSDPSVPLSGRVQPSTLTRSTSTTTTRTVLPANFPKTGGFFDPVNGYVPFVSFQLGSIVGIGANGEVLRIEVPETAQEFSADIFGLPAPATFRESLSFDAGYFEINPGNASYSALPIDLFGIGFRDLKSGFTFAVFDLGPATEPVNEESFAPSEIGAVLLGQPTPGQIAVFPGTSTLSTRANTAMTFVFETDQVDFGFFDTVLADGAESAFSPGNGPEGGILLIANGNRTLFPTSGASVPAGRGKALAAEVFIDEFGGFQDSDFTVFAAPVLTSPGGGPEIDATALGTASIAGLFIEAEEIPVFTFPDGAGNTVFGANGDFIAISSIDTATGKVVRPTVRDVGSTPIEEEPFATVLTRDPGGNLVANNPLPLPSQTTFRQVATNVTNGGIIDNVIATGFAECSTGQCGDDLNATASGLYALTAFEVSGNSGSLTFQNPNNSTVDQNGVGMVLRLDSGSLSNIDPGSSAGDAPFIFRTQANNPNSAFFTDELFGIAASNAIVVAEDDALGATGDLIAASSQLAGFGILPDPSVFTNFTPGDETPEFLRWGWWSAAYNPLESGIEREDIVHLGNWIAGQSPDPTDIPTSGTGIYSGLAIGTQVDYANFDRRIVAGDFRLVYNFAVSTPTGTLELRIGDADLGGITVTGDAVDAAAYEFNGIAGPFGANIRGRFFSGGGDPVAATAGQFNLTNSGTRVQIVGVFGSDRKN